MQPAQLNAQSGAGGEKTIEDTYQKLTQLDHILLRPDTYIGSTEAQQQKLWVHDGTALVFREVSYVPGLYKIFDEILVNAADNKVRDPRMDMLRVDIDPVRPILAAAWVCACFWCTAVFGTLDRFLKRLLVYENYALL